MLPTHTMSGVNGTIEQALANFDTGTFAFQFLYFGIPFVAVTVGAFVVFWLVNFKISFIR